jgi:hypothetical protein
LQLSLHSEAHISMSCYISIAMYMNRLKKLFILRREWMNGRVSMWWSVGHHPLYLFQSSHNQFISLFSSSISKLLFMYNLKYIAFYSILALLLPSVWSIYWT